VSGLRRVADAGSIPAASTSGFEPNYALETQKPAASAAGLLRASGSFDDARLVGNLDASADRRSSVRRVNAIHEDIDFGRIMSKAGTPSWMLWPVGWDSVR
jgi:hypothetical protein